MKHFKVTVQYLNGTEYVFNCQAEQGWQAAAMARVEGRRNGYGHSVDVKDTIVEEINLKEAA